VQSAYAAAGEEPLERLRHAGIPVYPTVQRLVAALARTVAPRDPAADSSLPSGAVGRQSAANGGPLAAGPGGGQHAAGAARPNRLLPLEQAAALLARYGITLPPLITVHDDSELDVAFAQVSYPACVKLASPDIAHKSDVGGVRLHLPGKTAVREAARALWDRFAGAPLLIMPMLPPGTELLAGATSDPTFGPVVIIGRGGVFAETDPDVALRLAPISPAQARQALLSLRCAPVLAGTRGQPPADLEALAGLIAALSRLAAAHPGLSIEMNPVIAYPDGYAIADLRATRTPASGKEEGTMA